jgi:hypothetical protein
MSLPGFGETDDIDVLATVSSSFSTDSTKALPVANPGHSYSHIPLQRLHSVHHLESVHFRSMTSQTVRNRSCVALSGLHDESEERMMSATCTHVQHRSPQHSNSVSTLDDVPVTPLLGVASLGYSSSGDMCSSCEGRGMQCFDHPAHMELGIVVTSFGGAMNSKTNEQAKIVKQLLGVICECCALPLLMPDAGGTGLTGYVSAEERWGFVSHRVWNIAAVQPPWLKLATVQSDAALSFTCTLVEQLVSYEPWELTMKAEYAEFRLNDCDSVEQEANLKQLIHNKAVCVSVSIGPWREALTHISSNWTNLCRFWRHKHILHARWRFLLHRYLIEDGDCKKTTLAHEVAKEKHARRQYRQLIPSGRPIEATSEGLFKNQHTAFTAMKKAHQVKYNHMLELIMTMQERLSYARVSMLTTEGIHNMVTRLNERIFTLEECLRANDLSEQAPEQVLELKACREQQLWTLQLRALLMHHVRVQLGKCAVTQLNSSQLQHFITQLHLGTATQPRAWGGDGPFSCATSVHEGIRLQQTEDDNDAMQVIDIDKMTAKEHIRSFESWFGPSTTHITDAWQMMGVKRHFIDAKQMTHQQHQSKSTPAAIRNASFIVCLQCRTEASPTESVLHR